TPWPAGTVTLGYINRQRFINSLAPTWTATVSNDELILSNVVDGTYKWDGVTAAVTPILGAPPAAILSSFLARPIAARVVDGGTLFPQRVQWPDIGTNDQWAEVLGSEAGFQDVAEGADWN